MRAYGIRDIKGCMAHILTKETFDSFLLSEAKIVGKASFHITGIPAKDFYREEPLDESGYVAYGRLRDVLLSVIRGKETPESFTLMFLLPRQKTEELIESSGSVLTPSDVEQLSLLVRFKEGELSVSTGSAYRIFTTDKTLNDAWDRWVENFLTKHDLPWDVMA